jgi:phosphatidylglycerol---prolipoprotein diacylglyceryl transferase
VRPQLFEVLGWEVPTHEFFVALGVAVATVVYFLEARRRRRLSEETWWIAASALIGGALLAKVGSAWRFVGSGATIQELLLFGGRSILGGMAGAYFGAIIAKRLLGYRRSTGDLFAPAVAIGLAVGRIGCFLTEQVGTPTSLPWGITVSPEAAASIPNCPQCLTGTPMHPSFLYEIVFLVVAFVVLRWGRDRFAGEGISFKVFLLAYGIFRFGVEFVRGNPEMAFGLSGSQLFLLVTIPILLIHILRSWSPRLEEAIA